MRRTRPTVSEIELDLGRYELRRQGRRVKLEKKPMELLIFLVSRRDQMVSRQEIVGNCGARICSSIPSPTSTTLCEKSAPLLVTTALNRASLKPWWAKATDLSDRCV